MKRKYKENDGGYYFIDQKGHWNGQRLFFINNITRLRLYKNNKKHGLCIDVVK